MIKSHLSPKELADAIGVSESSLKRWADDGVIAVTRTSGGHRRIGRQEAVRFVRQTGAEVVRPQLLGFPEAKPAPAKRKDIDSAGDVLFDALLCCNRQEVLGLVQGWFLAGEPLAWIFDGPIAAAMERMGRLWRHEEDGVLFEHRATDLCVQAVTQIRLALPPERVGAPTAVGAASSGDPYILPTLMASAVLQDAGLRAVNLGPETPLRVLQAAAKGHEAILAWLSVSTAAAAESVGPGLAKMAKALQRIGTHVVIGGRSAHLLSAVRQSGVTFAKEMAELAAFATGLMAATDRRSSR